jgi:hypothetical protein
MRFSKRKEFKSIENVALFNNTHKANDKVCFYCKKPIHFEINCLKKKNDEKEKANKLVKMKNKCLLQH